MMSQSHKGFTIIEAMLFLAISGFLAIALLVGAGGAIQRQQYRDSVQSFADFLKGEYDRVINVENDRGLATCPLGGGASHRGQSSCLIVGRVVTADASHQGREYSSFPVYAAKQGDEWNYTYSHNDKREYRVPNEAKTRLSNQADNSTSITLMMFRDPEVGQLQIRTTDASVDPSNLNNFLSGESVQGGDFGDAHTSNREVCVYDNGWLAGERVSVFLNQRSASADAITTGLASDGCKKF